MGKGGKASKARMAFYAAKGESLTRTHTFCPKCGPGVVMAQHTAPNSRRSCGKCGYSETDRVTVPAAPKPARGKGGPKAERAPSPPAAAPSAA